MYRSSIDFVHEVAKEFPNLTALAKCAKPASTTVAGEAQKALKELAALRWQVYDFLAHGG